MLLKITIDDTYTLKIPSDAKIRFDIFFPLFQTDAIPGSVVLPFEVDGLPNDETFQYARFLEVNRQIRLYSCKIYADTQLLCSGKLICKKSKPTKYLISIIINSLASTFAQTNIKSISYGPDRIICNPNDAETIALHATNVVLDIEPSDIYTFPQVYNETFYGDANPDFGGVDGGVTQGKYINLYKPTGFGFNHSHPPQTADIPDATNVYTLVPYLRLNWALQKIFQSVGFNLSGSYFSDAALQKALIANYYPLDLKKSKYGLSGKLTGILRADGTNTTYHFTDIVDPDSCKQANNRYLSKYNGVVQVSIRFKATSGPFVCTNRISLFRYSGGTTIKEQTIDLPGIDFSIAKEYNLSFSCETSINDQLTLADDSSDSRGQIFIEVGSTIVWTHIGYSNTNCFNNQIHYANHLPSITVGSLINSLRLACGLAVWFDPLSNEVEFSFLDEVLNSGIGIDLTPYIDPAVEQTEVLNDKSYSLKYNTQDVATPVTQKNIGDFLTYDLLPVPDQLNVTARVISEKRYYIYKQDDTGLVDWFFYSDDLIAVTVSAPDEATTEEIGIDLKLSTLRTIEGRMMMESKQAATSPAFDTGVNDYPLELCFDHGMIADRNDLDYPFASPFQYNAAGDKILDASFDLYSPESLYVRHHKPWLQFLTNCEEVTESLTINIEVFIEILKLASVQKGPQKRKAQLYNTGCIPKSFSVEFDMELNTIKAEAILAKPGGFPTTLNVGTGRDLSLNNNDDPDQPLPTPLELGQPYRGGLIIYIDNTGQHGLICGPENLIDNGVTTIRWFNGFNRDACNTLPGIGEGLNNTNKILNTIGASGWAANICHNYRGSGYSDWYLPSKEEALLIYQLYLSTLGNFLSTDVLWTSTEYDRVYTYKLTLSTGFITQEDDYNYNRVRPIRSF